MKSKYLALIMAIIMCFSFICGTVTAADEPESTQSAEITTTKSTEEQLGGALEGILGKDPSEVGDKIMGGVYEAQGFLRTIYNALENARILFANIINMIFKQFNLGSGSSLFG